MLYIMIILLVIIWRGIECEWKHIHDHLAALLSIYTDYQCECVYDHLAAFLSKYIQCKSGSIDYNLVALL